MTIPDPLVWLLLLLLLLFWLGIWCLYDTREKFARNSLKHMCRHICPVVAATINETPEMKETAERSGEKPTTLNLSLRTNE